MRATRLGQDQAPRLGCPALLLPCPPGSMAAPGRNVPVEGRTCRQAGRLAMHKAATVHAPLKTASTCTAGGLHVANLGGIRGHAARLAVHVPLNARTRGRRRRRRFRRLGWLGFGPAWPAPKDAAHILCGQVSQRVPTTQQGSSDLQVLAHMHGSGPRSSSSKLRDGCASPRA